MTTSTQRGVFPSSTKLCAQFGIGRDRGAADDAHGLAHAGNEKQQRDARIAHQIAQAVDAIVAAAIGDQQRLLVAHAHEAGRIAARRAIETFGPAGREHDKGRGLDQRAILRADVVDLFDQRRAIGLFAIERFELAHGGDEMIAGTVGRHAVVSCSGDPITPPGVVARRGRRFRCRETGRARAPR